MAGVRIQHETARNARFTVAEPIPYPTPYQCTPPEFGGCGLIHAFKTHHLNLDEAGAVIVGDTLYKKIKDILTTNGFSQTNVVNKPPTLRVGIGPRTKGTWSNIPIIEGVSRG